MGLTSDDEMDYVSPYVTPEGSGPTSKVTSVSHSPPSAKKHSIHSTMSVPANLKEAAEHLNPERRLFIGCIDEVRFCTVWKIKKFSLTLFSRKNFVKITLLLK